MRWYTLLVGVPGQDAARAAIYTCAARAAFSASSISKLLMTLIDSSSITFCSCQFPVDGWVR